MRHFILFVVAVLCLSACKTDLTDIEKRITEVEQQGKELEEANRRLQETAENLKRRGEELEEEARRRQEENERIQQELQALEDEINYVEAHLLSMEFVAADNPLQLIENTPCTIIGDSVVECRILNVTDDKVLIPRFTFQGSRVTINGVEAESGKTQFDFSSPVVLSVITASEIKDYDVYVTSYTGLPTVWIDTNGHVNVANPNQYYGGSIKVVDNPRTRAATGVTQASVKIMGLSPIKWYRPDYILSNSTDMLLAKNAYKLKFNNNISLLDDPSGTTWGLYPCSGDLTFLHQQTAYNMSRMSKLGYTPGLHHVEMFLNSRFFGTYVLQELIEVSDKRLDIGSTGFLLSVGSGESGFTFYTNYLENPVTVVSPASIGSEWQTWVNNMVLYAENALFSPNFTDASTGWQQFMDIDSFVDWYLINEIARNENGAFKSNCMMTLQSGGKLKMGPVGDFEKAFDNNSNASSTGFVIKNTQWFNRLFQDPAFVAKVKERFGYFYDHQLDIISGINADAEYLKYAVKEDDNKWDTYAAYTSSTISVWQAYGTKVGAMKVWLSSRMNWLKREFDAMA